MTPKGILFLNPRAGTFPPDEEAEIRALAQENGLRVVEIVRGVDIRSMVREALAAGMRTFLAGGGDGSIHHVAQALVGTEGVLGIVPIGTVNHLARDLGLPVGNWRAAFEIAVRGPIHQIDVGRVNGHYFLNSAMLGMYPTISALRERFRSVHSKWRSYFKATRLGLRKFSHVHLVLEFDGRVETLHTQMFMVAVNSYDLTQLGMVAPKMTFTDGRLSIYALTYMNRTQFIRATAKYLRGKIDDIAEFRRTRTTQLRVDSGRGRLRIALDGEIEELETPLQIAVVPASLLVRRAE